MKKKWSPPVLTVLARENPRRHVLTPVTENSDTGAHQQRATEVRFESIFVPVETVVAREIEGNLVLVPAASGNEAPGDAFLMLNETGRAVWECPDGRRTLSDMVDELSRQYDAPVSEIRKDAASFAGELLRRHVITLAGHVVPQGASGDRER